MAKASTAVLLALAAALAAGPALAEDGEALFQSECASCHSLGPSSTPEGPTLKGVVWRRVAALPDFDYSEALKRMGGRWSPSRLDEFLKRTQGEAHGNNMFFAIEDRAERRAIIDYLKTVK